MMPAQRQRLHSIELSFTLLPRKNYIPPLTVCGERSSVDELHACGVEKARTDKPQRDVLRPAPLASRSRKLFSSVNSVMAGKSGGGDQIALVKLLTSNTLTPGLAPSGIRLSNEIKPRSIVAAVARGGNNSNAEKTYRPRHHMVFDRIHQAGH